MKKVLSIIIVILSILTLFLFTSCDDENNTEDGAQAAKEFCECYKTNSLEYCKDELKDYYGEYQLINDEFLSAFNKEAATCNVKLEKIIIP